MIPFSLLLTAMGALVAGQAYAGNAPLGRQPLPELLVLAAGLLAGLVMSLQAVVLRKIRQCRRHSEAELARQRMKVLGTLDTVRRQEANLLDQLAGKNKQLVRYDIYLSRKNELLAGIKVAVYSLKTTNVRENANALKQIKRLLEVNAHLDKDWLDVGSSAEVVHHEFYQLLKAYHPQLTSHERKLCSLLRLNMNIKEVAGTLGIAPESVKKARYRLRKKMGLPPRRTLNDHIATLENRPALLPNAQSATETA